MRLAAVPSYAAVRAIKSLLLPVFCALFVSLSNGAAQAPTEILWDRWGVPHIYAPDLNHAMFAFGQAQMQSHGDLILRLYGQARGRGAEYWGADLADVDRWVRTMGVPARAAAWEKQQTPEALDALKAFVDGVNAFATAHPDRVNATMRVVLPVTITDVLAHVQRVVHFTFLANPQSLEPQMRRWADGGSNTWAIAPKRSASGKSLLLVNPHLPWGDFFTWYEAQIGTPSYSAYGAALVGMPFFGIAFNDRIGWSHTNNTIDGADLYELSTADGGYRWDGEVRPFVTRTETLKIKQPDGTVRDETLTIRESVHGPVVRAAAGKALALRVAGIDQPNILNQYLQMSRAKNLAEFEAALRPLQMPFFTVMYADREGHIMHLFGGRTPMRPAGDYQWSGIVPGTSSSTLWTATHPYAELPRVADPPSGWLQNANDPPWTTTFPLAIDPNKFPRYMAPRAMSFRAQRSAELVESDTSITLDEFGEYKQSTRMALADRVLDDLLPPAKAAGGPAAEAAAVLESWDRCADADSRGAVLFEAWFRLLSRGGAVFATPWSEASPRTTPDGLRDPAAAVRALVQAADQVKKTHGAMDVPWGQVYRLRVGGRDLPANGGPGELGIFRVVGFTEDKDGKWRAAGGDSYVATIEFGQPVRARTLMSYGNASQPGSPHAGDQLELFAKKQLKTAWLARADVERNLERREVVNR
ncbi:MAG TPA: acylase [Vicinamibacterales bacterium]|nr:acylase [Vicinamibacterales bacterium]